MRECLIDSDIFTPAELCQALTAHAGTPDFPHVELRTVSGSDRLRLPDATIVVALVAATGSAMVALVTGILKLLEKRQLSKGRIVVTGSAGNAIEFPADTPKERIVELLEIAKELDAPKISVLGASAEFK